MKRTISAFMDGELDEDEALRVIQSLTSEDKAFRDDWAVYHLIRDVMQDRSCVYGARVVDPELHLAEAGPLVASDEKSGASPVTKRGSWPSWRLVSCSIVLALLIAVVTLMEVFRGVESDAERGGAGAGEVISAEMQADSAAPLFEIDEYVMAHQGFSARGAPVGPVREQMSERSGK